MRNQKLDAVYSSPLMRAIDTAQAIARTHGLKKSPLMLISGKSMPASWTDCLNRIC
jgi:broad specificity phosphatase PhoE